MDPHSYKDFAMERESNRLQESKATFFQVQGHQHPRAVKNIYGKKKMDKLKLNGMIIYFFELNLTNKDTSICAKEAYHLMEGKKFKGKESRKLQGRLIIKIIRQPKRRRL